MLLSGLHVELSLVVRLLSYFSFLSTGTTPP